MLSDKGQSPCLYQVMENVNVSSASLFLFFLISFQKQLLFELLALTTWFLVRGQHTMAQALYWKSLSNLVFINDFGFIVSVHLL